MTQRSIVRPQRLYVSCDGAMYPTRYRKVANGQKRLVYQEMKCATVFWQEGTSPWHKRVQSSRAEVDEFGLSVWALAVLITQRINGSWDAFWASRPLHRAA